MTARLACLTVARALRCGVAREDATLAGASGAWADRAGTADHDTSGEILERHLDSAEAHRRRNRAQVDVLVQALEARDSTPEK